MPFTKAYTLFHLPPVCPLTAQWSAHYIAPGANKQKYYFIHVVFLQPKNIQQDQK